MWIICTTTSPDGEFLYGMTYLHNDFFVISLKTDEIVFFGPGSWCYMKR
jgi:hypothetical protein